MTDHTDAVLAVLRRAPGFADLRGEDCQMTRLGGLTNLVHLVDTGAQRVIVRIPGAGTEAYIDRAVEITNARAAWRAGVSAEVIWADAASGAMVTRAIDGIETMTPALFASRPGAPARAGQALARLHGSGETFAFRFELFAMID
ncbi:MAG: phosphotransferase, partial [Rhodobacteraceae bacterium]|nr:phosphotransferase [Paracoccaceae bacterium]